MQWYLTPGGLEFSRWLPLPMSRAIGNVSLSTVEPQAAQTGSNWGVYPLTDNGASPPAGKVVNKRTVTVSNGVATASYTYRDMTVDELATQQEARSDAVNAERARRITEGTTVNVTGVGAIPVAGREEDTRNLQGLVTAAQLRLASGDTTTAISFRDDANNMHALAPAQVVELWEKAAGYISAVYAASWTLKDGTIPADYADDRHWP